MDALLVKDEAQRIQSLEPYDVRIAGTDAVLDDLAGLAAQICETPVAMICVADEGEVCLLGSRGISSEERTPRRLPYGAGTSGALWEVSDLRLEPGFSPDGLQIEEKSYCYYASVALTASSGASLGVLAVMDVCPRQLTVSQANGLGVLGRQVSAHLERARQAEETATQIDSTLEIEKSFVSSVLDTIGALVMVFDTAGRIVKFNRACEATSGYGSAMIMGEYLWDRLIPIEEIPETIEAFARLRSGVFPTAFENRWLNRDGTTRRISWFATALHDADEKVAFIIATGVDVTMQREAELTLRESEARYRQLVESSLGMVFTHDMRGRLLSLNAHGAETMGRTIEEMLGLPLSDLVPVKRRAAILEYLKAVSEEGEAQGLLHLAHSDGEIRVIAYRNRLIRVPGRTPYVLGFGIDVTEQVRTERKLRTLTRQSNSILESVGDGIFCIDLEGKVTVVNLAAAQMLGYRQEEMLGCVMHTLIHHTRADGMIYPMEESPIRRSLSNFGTARVVDEVFWRKDGTCFPVDYIARPLIDAHASESGEIRTSGVVVAFTDTTERRALDRMKDEFISTVSHELRTPLTSLRGALGLLSGDALKTRPEKSQQMLEIAINNTDRLIRLVNDILDLERISSGKNELRLTAVRADELLRTAVGMQRDGNPGSNTRILFAAADVRVWADSDRILQVLQNLLSNATKFSAPEEEIHLTARRMDGDEALFEVRDYGQGIAEDELENIFDRFRQGDASDSRAIGGTGLGLAICRRIINQHGGRIWATSTPGKGTTFHFTLPTKPLTNLR
ncbi:MAG TPA: PAS domain S-box protein [Edaphobacter sp.]|nr:PAS domain S-box protein [Edaphobacter sp.]